MAGYMLEQSANAKLEVAAAKVEVAEATAKAKFEVDIANTTSNASHVLECVRAKFQAELSYLSMR